GAQETIYSLIMMRDRFLTESAHITEIDPEFADLPIIRERIDNAQIDTFLTNSFGFGGTNGCLVVGRV
ncbi:MAG: beta-ketoacyl-ACP synthase I, partial [Parvularculaceae bacterium]